MIYGFVVLNASPAKMKYRFGGERLETGVRSLRYNIDITFLFYCLTSEGISMEERSLETLRFMRDSTHSLQKYSLNCRVALLTSGTFAKTEMFPFGCGQRKFIKNISGKFERFN
jgi:hypothetical protein